VNPIMHARMAVFLLGALPAIATPQTAGDFARMVQTEYDFSAAATRTSQRAAFLEYIVADGILFRPGPVSARKVLSEGKGSPGILHWYPEFAEISNRGDLGLSTGPWIYWASGQAPAQGHFVSIWRRQSNGDWRAELDGGIGHAAPAVSPARLLPAARAAIAATAVDDSVDHTASLEKAELEFARLNIERGYTAALSQVALPAVRVYRNEHEPFVGLQAAVVHLRDAGPVGYWRPERVISSGDFGYSYGVVAGAGDDAKPAAAYVHVWKRVDGAWRLLLDLLIPMQ